MDEWGLILTFLDRTFTRNNEIFWKIKNWISYRQCDINAFNWRASRLQQKICAAFFRNKKIGLEIFFRYFDYRHPICKELNFRRLFYVRNKSILRKHFRTSTRIPSATKSLFRRSKIVHRHHRFPLVKKLFLLNSLQQKSFSYLKWLLKTNQTTHISQTDYSTAAKPSANV